MGKVRKSFMYYIRSLGDQSLVPKPPIGECNLFALPNGEIYKKQDDGGIVSMKESFIKKFEEDEYVVGKWYDGREVYEKVVFFENGSQEVDLGVEYGIIDLIVDHSAIFCNEDKTIQATSNDFASYNLTTMKVNLNNTSSADWGGHVRFKFVKL